VTLTMSMRPTNRGVLLRLLPVVTIAFCDCTRGARVPEKNEEEETNSKNDRRINIKMRFQEVAKGSKTCRRSEAQADGPE
jgi:hypothetical protein